MPRGRRDLDPLPDRPTHLLGRDLVELTQDPVPHHLCVPGRAEDVGQPAQLVTEWIGDLAVEQPPEGPQRRSQATGRHAHLVHGVRLVGADVVLAADDLSHLQEQMLAHDVCGRTRPPGSPPVGCPGRAVAQCSTELRGGRHLRHALATELLGDPVEQRLVSLDQLDLQLAPRLARRLRPHVVVAELGEDLSLRAGQVHLDAVCRERRRGKQRRLGPAEAVAAVVGLVAASGVDPVGVHDARISQGREGRLLQLLGHLEDIGARGQGCVELQAAALVGRELQVPPLIGAALPATERDPVPGQQQLRGVDVHRSHPQGSALPDADDPAEPGQRRADGDVELPLDLDVRHTWQYPAPTRTPAPTASPAHSGSLVGALQQPGVHARDARGSRSGYTRLSE